MRDHDCVAVTIPLQGGTHLLPDRVTDVLLHGGDAAEVLGMIGVADRLDELVEKRVIALA